MPALSSTQSKSSLEEVESALKTKAVDILSKCIDALSGLDRAAAYQAVMNEPTLLDEALSLLREDPHLFSEVMVDPQGEAVEAKDDARLRCGETLGYVKTLVVRASARRHFRRKLGGPRTVIEPIKKKSGPLRRLLESVGLVDPPRPKRRKIPGKGDRLYKVMRDYLVFDWQVRLIPDYAQFEPEIVTRLGASLLQIREPAELRALAGEEGRNSIRQKRRPLFLCEARQVMKTGGDCIDAEILWKLWDQMDLARLFSGMDVEGTRKVIAEIAGTSKSAITLLMPILGHDVRLFITFLFVAYQHLERTTYRNIFCDAGTTTWMCKSFAERLIQLPSQPPPDLTEMTRVYTEILTTENKLA